MDISETLVTLGTQDAVKKKTQHRKLKRVATQTPPKITEGKPRCSNNRRSRSEIHVYLHCINDCLHTD
jgi:hypothetical protein